METLEPVHQCPNRFVTSATWDEYSRFLEAVGDRPIRINYDRGRLEIMSPSNEHERVKKRLAILLELALIELGVDFAPGGSMTFRRKDLERGLEPDECYWIRTARELEAVEGELDFTRDPAPDLALEVDITSSFINRLGLYAALGVGEVWRYREPAGLEVLTLGPEGQYAVVKSSRLVPQLPVAELTRFLGRGKVVKPDDVQRFRSWVRSLT